MDLILSCQFHELIFDKAECALKRSEGIVFKVNVLRPSDCSGFIATINGEEVAMIKQNRFFLTHHNYFIEFLCGCFQ